MRMQTAKVGLPPDSTFLPDSATYCTSLHRYHGKWGGGGAASRPGRPGVAMDGGGGFDGGFGGGGFDGGFGGPGFDGGFGGPGLDGGFGNFVGGGDFSNIGGADFGGSGMDGQFANSGGMDGSGYLQPYDGSSFGGAMAGHDGMAPVHDMIIINDYGGGFGYGYDPGLAVADGLVTGMLLGSLMGGYYSPWASPYYMRPYYCRPAWEPGWWDWGGGPPRPWWAYEGYGNYSYGDRTLPAEVWPVVVFDVARTQACRRLDVRTSVSQFRHDVPTREALVRCDCWQPALRRGWYASKPHTHQSCAAALVLFDAHDPESFEEAKVWCEHAMGLTEHELDETRLFTVMVVACVYGNEEPLGSKWAEQAGSTGSGANGSSGGDQGEPRMIADARAFCELYGHFFQEAAVSSNEEMHIVMATLVQHVIGKLVARRRKEQLHEAALKQLAAAMEPKGIFKKPSADEIWRAIEQARKVGVSEARLAEAKKRLESIENAEQEGSLIAYLNPMNLFGSQCVEKRKSKPKQAAAQRPNSRPAPDDAVGQGTAKGVERGGGGELKSESLM